MTIENIQHSPLGKKTEYVGQYMPDLLFTIPRKPKRKSLGIGTDLPFSGVDIWNAYELSWLNTKGKPMVGLASFTFPCESPFIFESKSLKLYLNSLNQTKFDSSTAVIDTLKKDLSKKIEHTIDIQFSSLEQKQRIELSTMDGICIDSIDTTIESYQLNPTVLSTESTIVTETLVSHLLKSNCPVTGQPDWASLQIHYQGKKIHHENLLKYIISYRSHEEFHEQCVERIFIDLMRFCEPNKLSVYARYTRRGGLDINPFRSNFETPPLNCRLWRQ